jgi:hypothetical protein
MGSKGVTFSSKTLEVFEAAAASIPMRQLDRAFAGADIRLGKDPGGPDGTRRVQFRRYVASIDQRDPHQRDRLGDVLGALIDEVATSKQEFLVKAAESDGFAFDGASFRPAATAPSSFAVTRIEDFASIDERGRRLQLLANDRLHDAIAGATELADSMCRTVVRASGAPAPAKTAGLVAVATAALKAIDSAATRDTKDVVAIVAVVAHLGSLKKGVAPRHARLAVGAAVAFAVFVAETYTERAASKKG